MSRNFKFFNFFHSRSEIESNVQNNNNKNNNITRSLKETKHYPQTVLNSGIAANFMEIKGKLNHWKKKSTRKQRFLNFSN